MANERYPRNTDPQGDYYGRRETQDYGRDYGAGGSYSYSSARSYEATGEYDDRDRDDRNRGGGRGRDYGRGDMNRGYGRQYGAGESARDYGSRDMNRGQSSRPYYGSYAADGQRFTETVGSRGDRGDYSRNERYGRRDTRYGADRGDYGRQPQGYDYDDRGFMARAGDEVRSWFGDDEAERRREMDQRYDQRNDPSYGRDSDYHDWRSQQISALDRDYDEYRTENRQKFHSEFGSWRQERQGQRDSLSKVSEHMEVVGSDGGHVGTVDKVRGDRIILTKNDEDAGGRHHSIPSRWIESVDDKVKIRKSADDAHAHWKDEERNQAFFADNGDEHRGRGETDTSGNQGNLDRSFSGTYRDR